MPWRTVAGHSCCPWTERYRVNGKLTETLGVIRPIYWVCQPKRMCLRKSLTLADLSFQVCSNLVVIYSTSSAWCIYVKVFSLSLWQLLFPFSPYQVIVSISSSSPKPTIKPAHIILHVCIAHPNSIKGHVGQF